KMKKVQPILTAPTGRASQRMAEASGVEAKTIHRLLGYEDGKFVHSEFKPLPAKFVVIDEASMLDTKLASAIISAVPNDAHIVFVGDIDQLPSVGAGNVLKDLISSQKFSTTRLERIFRQGERSQIVITARDILNGVDSTASFPPTSLNFIDKNNDINFIDAPTPEDCIASCVKLIRDKIPQWYGCDSIDDVQVLAPMHKGTAGIESFNQALKSALNGDKKAWQCIGKFAVGDKVMQTRNNYDLDIFNGDMGRIGQIIDGDTGVSVNMDGRKVAISRNDMSDLQIAYAISIHKSQGSEFPIVIIPLLRQHFIMLQRNLLYTALTRGRKKVFIIGDESAWKMAVKNIRSTRRRTFLKERLESI
ncbi:MAG: AAA family ATPase, partial [Opitutales bacterium]|nr:AAA family ATPase [Opitutales bacterium]